MAQLILALVMTAGPRLHQPRGGFPVNMAVRTCFCGRRKSSMLPKCRSTKVRSSNWRPLPLSAFSPAAWIIAAHETT